MKIAVVLVVSCAVLALVKAQDMNMKAVKLPEDMLEEHMLSIPEARGEMQADEMQRRGGGKGGKGGDSGPPPAPGWGPPMGGWGPPPMMGWGGPMMMGGGYGGPAGYGR